MIFQLTLWLPIAAAAALLTPQWLAWLFLRLCRRQPGPFPLPLVGNLLHLIVSPLPHHTLRHLSHIYGPIFYLQLGNVPTVVVSSSAAAHQILHANDKFLASRPDSKAIRSLLYSTDKSAFMCPYGDRWRSIRKFYSLSLFAPRYLQELHIPIIAEEIKGILMSDVYSASRVGTEVDLSKIFSFLTQNIMYRIILGKRPSDIPTTLTDMYGLAHEIERLVSANQMGEFIPILSFLDYKINRRINRLHRIVDAVLEGVIAEYEERNRLQASDNCGSTPLDAVKDGRRKCMVDALLAADPPFDRDEMKAMAMELLIAGSSISSAILDWAMVELLTNERVMKKAVEEVDNAVGKERMVTMEDVRNKMPYIGAVVKETLRLHAPAPLLLPHMAIESCEVNLGAEGSPTCKTFRIAAGTRVLVNVWAIGRDEAAWGPSASEFAPERFMEGGMMHDVNLRGQHFELLPFGSGRRMCPGLPIAISVLELTIASVLHCFRWTTHGTPLDMSEDFGLIVSRRAHLLAVPSPFRLQPILCPSA